MPEENIKIRPSYAGSFHSPRLAGYSASVVVDGYERSVEGIYASESAARKAAEEALAAAVAS